MNPGETKIGYIERCIVQETQERLSYPIKKFPEECIEDIDGACFFQPPSMIPCMKDEPSCIDTGEPEFIETIGDWELVDTCKKNEVIGQFPQLKAYLDTIVPAPVPVQSPRRSRRF